MPRPQFTLRALLVAMLALAVLVGFATEKTRKRRGLVAELESKGCLFAYSGDPFLPPIKEPPPEWLAMVFGYGQFPSPLLIVVNESASVTDDDVETIAAITSLRVIEIADASVTNAGVSRLKRLRPDCDVVEERNKIETGIDPWQED